jgi:hypothetical protein
MYTVRPRPHTPWSCLALICRLGLPSSHWLTCWAKRSEQRLSLAESGVGDRFTIMSVLPSPDRLLCSRYVSFELRNGIYRDKR